MAQFWEDWSGSTLNAEPTGWTKKFVTSGTLFRVEEDTSGHAPAGRRLLIDKSVTDRAAITFDGVGALEADVQVGFSHAVSMRGRRVLSMQARLRVSLGLLGQRTSFTALSSMRVRPKKYETYRSAAEQPWRSVSEQYQILGLRQAITG